MAKIKHIVPAPLFSRTFAAIIDLVLVVLIGAGVFLGISNIAYHVNWIKAYKDDFNQTLVDSGLMRLEKNEVKPYEYESYLDYQSLFYDFYHGFYAEETNKEYDVYWFNVFIYGQNDTLNKYEQKELDARSSLVKTYGPMLFTYAKDGEDIKANEFAIPVVSEQNTKELTDAGKKQLRQYFYVTDEESKEHEIAQKYKYIYFYVLADVTSLSKLQNDYNKFALYGTTLPLVIAIIITFIIFYFVIPLCFKNGETLGKKVMHICLVNKLGYQYQRVQLLPRFVFPTLLTAIVVFFTGFSIWAFIIVSFVILISFIFTIFSPQNRALHDLFAGTLVIDARESTWFKNASEEDEAEKDVATYVERVHSSSDALNDDNIIYTNPHFKDEKK